MNRYDGIDKRIVLNVKMYAKNLKRNSIFRSMDLEDLEQELMYEILLCIGKFDEGCGELEHFIRKVLKRRCATLIETYMRKKRDSVEEKILREVFIPIKIVKRGSAKSKIMHQSDSQKKLNRPLLRALAKAYR